ncbi:MAG: 1-(5-phosphoribosyl)-5-[(5-phosphoribosylamino)methylideneamino]imidazole-4-carboxamide isomerase, partial [Candidatus Hecatellaceae archaeon]
ELLEAGASWVILGTAAFKDPNLLFEAVNRFGAERLMVALDSAKGKILVEGWTEAAETQPLQAVRSFDELSLHAFLYTDVEVEGTLEGVRLEMVRRLVKAARTPIIYAGGVASLPDIERLKNVGVMGVVVGRALYDGKFTFEEARKAAEDP